VKFVFILLATLMFLPVQARNIFKIRPDTSYQRHRGQDLERRIWELERAVSQLQDQVFSINSNNQAALNRTPWSCTITAMGQRYHGVGKSKAEAESKAFKDCKTARKNTFFCKDAACERN